MLSGCYLEAMTRGMVGLYIYIYIVNVFVTDAATRLRDDPMSLEYQLRFTLFSIYMRHSTIRRVHPNFF